MQTNQAVLLMAYGTPDTLDDVEAYFTHIRGGRAPTSQAVAHLRARYERVGGRTPLREITTAVSERLEAALGADGRPHRVYVGMKHWHPYIADTMRRMKDDGVREATCIALAPHHSRLSVGAYRAVVEREHEVLGSPFRMRFVDRWYRQPRFVDLTANAIRAAMTRFTDVDRRSVAIVFTAHSLPLRIREWGDEYEAELMASSAVVARQAGIGRWHFAWQSAGGSQEPWIGPDILEFLDTLHAEGVRYVLQVPIGFVCDHLEVLYDIDVEAKEKARALGMRLERTTLPNASPEFVRVLMDIVADAQAM